MGWGKECGEAVQELQGRQAQCRAAGGIGCGEDVADLVGAAADEMEPLDREGRPGAVPDQALKAGAVGGLDADTGVQAEPAAVVPREHILGFVGLQEGVTAKVTKDPSSDRVLETL